MYLVNLYKLEFNSTRFRFLLREVVFVRRTYQGKIGFYYG